MIPKHGFFSCDLPVDTIQVSVYVDTKQGKHTLKKTDVKGQKGIELGQNAMTTQDKFLTL